MKNNGLPCPKCGSVDTTLDQTRIDHTQKGVLIELHACWNWDCFHNWLVPVALVYDDSELGEEKHS